MYHNMHVYSKKILFFLIAIVLVAFALRMYRLTLADSYTDEAIIAFRSIGLIDYDTSPVQTTPWQWLSQVPWWAHLSLHDHPLGYFVVQHIAYRLFGVGLFAVRFPSVLFGVASVFLLFLIGKKLFGERAGLVAASILAVQSYHLWVSRLGLQDGAVIAIILLGM